MVKWIKNTSEIIKSYSYRFDGLDTIEKIVEKLAASEMTKKKLKERIKVNDLESMTFNGILKIKINYRAWGNF